MNIRLTPDEAPRDGPKDLTSAEPLRENYQRGFRTLLWRVRTDRLQRAVDELVAGAELLVAGSQSPAVAWNTVYTRVRTDVVERLVRARASSSGQPEANLTMSRRRRIEDFAALLDRTIPHEPDSSNPDFHCDAGLGGLARWLRAGGYDARWWPDIHDDALLGQTLGTSAILLTTDRRLMKHGAIAHGVVAALLVPISLTKRQQFADTARQLDLPLRAARCMACGGRLVRVAKASVEDRIPPRTYPWLDDYFQCDRCDKLFWQGTHWTRIRAGLEQSRPQRPDLGN